MNRFKKELMAAAVLVLLGVIVATMNSCQGVAAQGPTSGTSVNIVNPLPVPVTGSLGITGTPNVQVTNPATAPVLVLNVNDLNGFTIGVPSQGPYYGNIVVPAKQRWVISVSTWNVLNPHRPDSRG